MALKATLLSLILLITTGLINIVHADTKPGEQKLSSFITLVNPVRISSYTPDSGESIRAQYGVIRNLGLSVTWLLTFDVITNKEAAERLTKMDSDQELGIFLEVTPKFAEGVGVVYHDTGFWHFATSVFLSGYTQEERIKLIDGVFGKFKEVFGYYPTSVGSWWTDSYSLGYMKDKYGITANLGVSDQFSTDGYQVWGQYFSTPYYPSKYHAGIPAPSSETKLDLVVLQWAARDPLNGYYDSRYSTQDYFTSPGLSIKYFEKLVELYASSDPDGFGQITLGLEGDFSPEAYGEEFLKQMSLVSNLAKNKGYRVTNMREFSDWYRKNFPNLSPTRLIQNEDLLGQEKESVWFQSPNYRLGYVLDKESGEIEIRDFRIFFEDMLEPYYVSPNRSINLTINIPSVFDKVGYEKDIWLLPKGSEIIFEEDKLTIKAKNADTPHNLQNYPGINIKPDDEGFEISFEGRWGIPREGRIIKGFSAEAAHFFKQKKAIFYLLTGRGWGYFKKINYQIPQEEVYALLRLSNLPSGRVLVFNGECLQCSWHTQYLHPAFANQRGYVKKFGKHPIVYDPGVFSTDDRQKAKELFDKLKVKYIYLVKFEDYMEKLPFSPGDLGIELVFSNAGSEIWSVKE